MHTQAQLPNDTSPQSSLIPDFVASQKAESKTYRESYSISKKACADHRKAENIFTAPPAQPKVLKKKTVNIFQIKPRKKNYLPVTHEEIIKDSSLQQLVAFFKSNSAVKSSNLSEFKYIFSEFLQNSTNLAYDFFRLKEELDKNCKHSDKFGKTFLGWQLANASVKLKIKRSKAQKLLQEVRLENYLAQDLNLVVVNKWENIKNRIEIVRNRTVKSRPNDPNNFEFISMDAKMWKTICEKGFVLANHMSYMDCIARNAHCMEEFVKQVNKVSVFNFKQVRQIQAIKSKKDKFGNKLITIEDKTGHKAEFLVTAAAVKMTILK